MGKESKNTQEMIAIEQMPEFPIDSEETQEMDLTIPPAEQESEEVASIPIFMLSLFQIADQAKIIHLQTGIDREHRHFGTFYEEFIGHIDILIESIAGKYGADKLKFTHASIVLYDREEALPIFFKVIDQTLRGTFCELFDRDADSELYGIVDDMLVLKNKVQYLLQIK